MGSGNTMVRRILLVALAVGAATACSAAQDPLTTQDDAGIQGGTTVEVEEQSIPPSVAAPSSAGTSTNLPVTTEFGIGVSLDPCPRSSNPGNGCITLGILNSPADQDGADQDGADQDGANLNGANLNGRRSISAVKAFWSQVNAEGGVGGFDVHLMEGSGRDAYQDLIGRVLGFAWVQMEGDGGAGVNLTLLQSDGVVAVPSTQSTEWLFSDVLLESGSPRCIDVMNGLDRLAEVDDLTRVVNMHLAGVGADAAGGTKLWTDANDVQLIDIPLPADPQAAMAQAGTALREVPADVVVLALPPALAGAIVDQSRADGVRQQVLVDDTVAEQDRILDVDSSLQVLGTSPWMAYSEDVIGYQQMVRSLADSAPEVDPAPAGPPAPEAFGPNQLDGPDVATVSGWVSSYPLLQILTDGVGRGDLTRQGLRDAVARTVQVDYRGLLPEAAGNLAGDPNGAIVRSSSVRREDDLGTYFSGPTATRFDIVAPCGTALLSG